MLRKVFFWCHLACGVAAGVVIFIMSVTGALLAYENAIVRPNGIAYRRAVTSTLIARTRGARSVAIARAA